MGPEGIRRQAEAFGIGPADSPILIVNDEPAICEILVEALNIYPTATANTVADAKAALLRSEFRLVITDKNLPDGSGLDVIAEGKSRQHPRTEYIIITGYGNVESAIEAVNLGVYSYLQKPFRIEQAKKHVEGALARNEAFFRNERLIQELSKSHAELFRRQTELDMGEELLDENVRERTRPLKTAIGDLVQVLEDLGASHGELAKRLDDLQDNKKVAKLIGPEVIRDCLGKAKAIRDACARYAAIGDKREVVLSGETEMLISQNRRRVAKDAAEARRLAEEQASDDNPSNLDS